MSTPATTNEREASSAMSGSDSYCPLRSLTEEVKRFKATNQFSPMLVTHFYAQAACVVRELEEARDIIRRLVKWDTDHPKKRVHSYRSETEHDQIVSDARHQARFYPNDEMTSTPPKGSTP